MDLKIFAQSIDSATRNQIHALVEQDAYQDSRVRILPNAKLIGNHIAGFTAGLCDKTIPSAIGTDVGCGVLSIPLGKINVDVKRLDKILRHYIPRGGSVHRNINGDTYPYEIEDLWCIWAINMKAFRKIQKSVAVLGSKCHFVEIDEDDEGLKYLVIHAGCGELGVQMEDIYQGDATGYQVREYAASVTAPDYSPVDWLNEERFERENKICHNIFRQGRYIETIGIPSNLCRLSGDDREYYLKDMRICMKFAKLNRREIANIIFRKMGWHNCIHNGGVIDTPHNYIDAKAGITRVGAVSANYNERLIVLTGNENGCLICKGKGNKDWNYSAPCSIDVSGGTGNAINEIAASVDVRRVLHPIYNYSAKH